MFKRVVLMCVVFVVAALCLGCGNKQSSLVGPDQNQVSASIGTYNSFPWSWHLPYKGSAYISQGYNGSCWGSVGTPTHVGSMYYAVDFAGGGAASGQPIYACAAGYVKFAGRDGGGNSGFGNQVIIEAGPTGQNAPYQNNRYLYRAAHMTSVAVVAGWWVDRGYIIGYVGATGNVTGPHIHFEVKRGVYGGSGGISGDSFPPSFAGGIDGYGGSCGYWQTSGQ
jgi:murein DD-endopeptidase MepM/ murein hydrolase activator NlpD